MGYGAQARRVPAKGESIVQDADIYKIGILGKFKRGIATVQRDIWSVDDLRKICGSMTTASYSPLVMKRFYEHLRPEVQVESIVKMYVASDAVQASLALNDTHGTPDDIFTVKAGLKGLADKSAFGNDIAVKTLRSENVTYKLTADTAATPTTALLDQVTGLQVGYQIKVADGTNTEYPFITAINPVTKQISFAALTNTYTAALTTVSRMDWNLYVAVKDDLGNYEQKESWLDIPFAKSQTLGMPLVVNDPVNGSFYLTIDCNISNATTGALTRPADITTWTPLASGSDGTAAIDANWNTLASDIQDYPWVILLAPESTSTTHNLNMAVFATNGDKGVFYGQAANKASADTLKNFGALLRSSVVCGMLPSDKWFETDDPTKPGAKVQIPPVGHAAAHWFNSYSVNGASKVAAGNRETFQTNDRLVDDNGLVHDDRNGLGGRLIRDYSVNISRFRRGKGITFNSARTFSTDSGYIYQSQLFQWQLYKRSILAYLQEIEQDKSGVRAQQSHRNAVWAYMYKKFLSGEFFIGQKEDGTETTFEDVVMIVNDFTINTLANIANGKEETFVQFIGPPPIEEPILSLASAGVTKVRG